MGQRATGLKRRKHSTGLPDRRHHDRDEDTDCDRDDIHDETVMILMTRRKAVKAVMERLGDGRGDEELGSW